MKKTTSRVRNPHAISAKKRKAGKKKIDKRRNGKNKRKENDK